MTIDSVATARVLADPRQRRLLLHLVDRGHSLQELSVSTGMTLSLLHYHVRRLCGLKLIESTHEVPRNGRPIKYYRARARAFFVPAHFGSDSNGFLSDVKAAFEAVHMSRPDEGTLYDVSASGQPRMRKIASRGKQVVAKLARVVHLSDAEASTLATHITKLMSRAGQTGAGRRRPYLLYCAVVPQP